MIPDTSSTEITEINRLLEEIPSLLNGKRGVVIAKRKDYLIAKANYENKFDMVYLMEKAKSDKKTQGDLKALSRQGSHKERLDMISAEAEMRIIQNEIKYLEDQYEAVLENSRTYRAELKTGFQG
jgi:hypothetical protein